MRKIIVVALALGLIHSFANAENTSNAEVESTSVSTNIVGIMEVLSKSPNTILAVPWTSFDENGKIRIDSLVVNTNLYDGDVIWCPPDNRADRYESWTLKNGKWEHPTGVDFSTGEKNEMSAEFALARGNAFWLVRNTPTNDVGEALPIYLIGQYSSEQMEGCTLSDSGYYLLASPNPVPFTPFASGKIEGATEGDKLYIQEADKRIEYVYNGSSWQVYKMVEKTKFNKTFYVYEWTDADATRKVPLGQGFWFLKSSSSSSKVNVHWN